MALPLYDSSSFPRPAAPALPVPSWGSFGLGRDSRPAGILSLPQSIHVYSGRYAISLALAHAGIGTGDKVLVPAYHCLAMVEPLRIAGVEPVYYPIRADASVLPEDVEPLFDDGVKALLVVHYFGFPQSMSRLRALADRLDIVLIEDCAHACYGKHEGQPLGSSGDYAVTSTLKFLPVGTGGVLASARRDLSTIRLSNPPLKQELKAAFNLLERATELGRLRPLGALLRLAVGLRKRITGGACDSGAPTPDPGEPDGAVANPEYAPEYAMDADWLGHRSTRVSRFLVRHARTGKLVGRRRDYFSAYLEAVHGRTDCRPLYPELPQGVIPQVFPLYVDNCLPVFVALKGQGVPIIRFGEFLDTAVTADLCPVSVDLADHLLQLPCHQELTGSEIDWIIRRLVAALESNAAVPPSD